MATDDELLAADREARDTALDVTRSFIVQAPAGSGKTELLIQRYLCLLATVAEPEEVVAITFTRKAAHEMQLRVIEALRRAASGAAGAAPHERRTLEAAAAVRARDRELGWSLYEAPRRMRIQTLDAFCASVARLLPVSSGLGGTLRTVADAGMQRMYREAAAATLDWLAGDAQLAETVERVLAHLDNDTAKYVGYLAGMLGTRDQWLSIIGTGALSGDSGVRATLEATIASQVEAQLQRVADALAAACDHELLVLARYAGRQLADEGEPSGLAALDVQRWPQTHTDNLVEWQALADVLLTKSGTLRKRVTRNEGFPPRDGGEKERIEQVLGELAEVPGLAAALARVRTLPAARYRDEQWQVLTALFRLLPVAVGELQRLFAERGVTDHIEVALAAQAALGRDEEPGDAVMLLDYRVRHLLVDEMQDTSVGQYRLLETLTGGWQDGDGRTVFCVGDPMQSIYRFRNAEVGQFLAARRRGIGTRALEPLLLRQNFRSGEHLVNWFNDVFAAILPVADDIAAGAIRYAHAVPVAGRRGEGRVELHPVTAGAPAEEASRTVAVIRRCLEDDPGGDLAVLVRSRTQVPALLSELRAARVPYRAVDIDRLTDLPEVIDLLALTRALCHRDDRIAWLGLLRGPWAGLELGDLHGLVHDDNSRAVLDLARDSTRVQTLSARGRERLNAFLERLAPHLRAHGARGLRERVETAWMALGGATVLDDDEQLANAYRYLDVLERLEVAGTLADVAALEQQLDEERVTSSGGGDARVQIMTMHKAKGLQFDHVVLPGLGRTARPRERAVLDWLNVAMPDGQSSMIISPLGPRTELEKDPVHRYIDEAAQHADRLELDRLLYVACTRARRSLHLVAHVGVDRDGALKPPPAGSLLHRLWPALGDEFGRRAALPAGDGERGQGDDERVYAAPRLRRFRDGWTPPAAAPLPGEPSTEHAPDSAIAVDYEWVGSTARHAGTLVHRWLQMLADGPAPVDDLPPAWAAVTDRWARALGVDATQLAAVRERVERALCRTLADERGRWLLFGPGASELRLTGVHAGRPQSIVLDRLRVDGGHHWIVDYKTGTHEGGDLDGFLAQEVARYRAQLERYGSIYRVMSDAPLHLALYFPLLGAFIEIPP